MKQELANEIYSLLKKVSVKEINTNKGLSEKTQELIEVIRILRGEKEDE